MPDWVPIQHQLDALRMDVQYVLRHVIEITDRGKVYRAAKKDELPLLLEDHGLLERIEGTVLFKATSFGRKQVTNDHVLRELAMVYMNLLTDEQLLTIQHDIFHWQFRDPVIREFMNEQMAVRDGVTIADFLPQAPWYYHTVGYRNVPRRLRDKEAESDYVKGGYTGKEVSAWDLVHAQEVA